jgi:DNA recombination protein RmuC
MSNFKSTSTGVNTIYTSTITKGSKSYVVSSTPVPTFNYDVEVTKLLTDLKDRKGVEVRTSTLYDKFEGFVGDLLKIGKKMEEAKVEYEGAMNKLKEGKGNLISSVERLKKMGAKAKKALPDSLINSADNKEHNTIEKQ